MLTVHGLEHSVCDVCGEEPVLTAQIRRNQKKVADAKRRADSLLTSENILTVRQRLGLTQQDAAALFGGGANAFSKYERGDVIQSVPMDRLLRLMDICPFLLPVLQKVAGAEVIVDAQTASYEKGISVCVNDRHYRSRKVPGEQVVVDFPKWRAA